MSKYAGWTGIDLCMEAKHRAEEEEVAAIVAEARRRILLRQMAQLEKIFGNENAPASGGEGICNSNHETTRQS